MSALSYCDFFAAACGDGRTPNPYLERLACEERFPKLHRRGGVTLPSKRRGAA